MKKLISNYLYTVLYQLLLMLTPFITTPYVARVLKAEGVGIDAYVLSIVQLFIVFIVLGIPLYGSRQIAVKNNKEETSKEFWSIFSFQAIISLLNIVVFLLFILLLDNYTNLFYIHFLTLLAYSFDISWFFIGKEQIKKISIRNMIVKVLGIILIFSFVKDADDLPLYVLINGGTLFFGQLIMWIPLLKEVKLVKISFDDMKKHVSPIMVLFIPQLLIQVYVLVNRIILGNIAGEIEVGYYNQANKVIKIALGVISSIGTVLLPRMASEFSKGNQDMVKKYTTYTLQFVLMITLPMTLGMMAIAPNFVVWFLGDEFLDVSTILILMSPVIFFVGLANVFGIQVLVSTNQQKKYSLSITIGALLSLIINYLLVSKYGSIATTIALLIAEATGALIQMYFARSYFIFREFITLFIKYFILSGFVYVSASTIGEFVEITPVLLTLLQVFVGAMIYLLGLFVIRDTLVLKLIGSIQHKIRKKVNE
ncbi:flippase [Metabacillus malikii]|uniref:O-antigen/teichoic acid export membrane protein n=1 Tax=Metabacillus malikii TaxID=1504265 RepID=A0ABT9ZI01_9BACI|nr:flippase [Metabacillus malikii]MDQ0231427.1 O-antigen/teichoic acid export membrane protein [Metabacillus malikii]